MSDELIPIIRLEPIGDATYVMIRDGRVVQTIESGDGQGVDWAHDQKTEAGDLFVKCGPRSEPWPWEVEDAR